MSYNDDMQEAKRKLRSKPKPETKVSGKSTYAFHPTLADKAKLAAGAMSLEGAVDILSKLIEQDCKLSVGYAAKTGAYFATIRDSHTLFPDEKSVSAFHGDVQRALISLAYCMQTYQREFPEIIVAQTRLWEDW